MITLKLTECIDTFLTEHNFKKNGYDYWKLYGLTNMEIEWDEEVYVFLTRNGYNVWYPQNEALNKLFKTTTWLIKYIKKMHP